MVDLLEIASVMGTATATPSGAKPGVGGLAGFEPVVVTGLAYYERLYDLNECKPEFQRLARNQLKATGAHVPAQARYVWVSGVPVRQAGWLLECHRQLEELLRLERDWDSYGAEPPNDLAVSLAKKVVRVLSQQGLSPPCINPSAEEGVCISFRAGRLYADMECFNSGEILAATSNGEGQRRVWEVESRDSEIIEAARRIRKFLNSRGS